jgi:shikimate dehydrogenase
MLETYSGATRVYFICGHPIAQARAPHGLTDAFERAGADAVVVPIDVLPDDVDGFITSASRLGNLDGIIATIPHKFAVVRHCATASATTRLLGVANLLRRNADRSWHGEMLDGASHVAAMRKAGATLTGAGALLVGAGGAGRAIGHALLESGVRQLAVHDLSPSRRDALIATLATVHPGKVVAGSADPGGFDTVTNATPAGMEGSTAAAVDTGGLRPEMFVSDVVTKPEVTPLLEAARRRGCRTCSGVDMFEAQLALMLDFYLEARR